MLQPFPLFPSKLYQHQIHENIKWKPSENEFLRMGIGLGHIRVRRIISTGFENESSQEQAERESVEEEKPAYGCHNKEAQRVEEERLENKTYRQPREKPHGRPLPQLPPPTSFRLPDTISSNLGPERRIRPLICLNHIRIHIFP